MNLTEKIRKNAGSKLQNIVLPETNDVRVLQAAEILQKEKLVIPILLGEPAVISKLAEDNNISLDSVEIIDPQKSEHTAQYANDYYELRKHKGMTQEQAQDIVKTPLFFAAFMLKNNMAVGAVAGSDSPTADVMRSAIQVVGVAPGINAVSSSFVMVFQDGRELTFGDCAVIPNPDQDQLTSIAISSAKTHERLVGKTANVAMLSFSTKGSAIHEDVEKVVAATEQVKQLAPELNVDGDRKSVV